ncbi:hypothetical protein VTK73DRAFT_911 [Phialemonium thermophilum]|uniref:Uncharacterized protein n=1 Tax=Phialemonium thermophilum TaxID=223376 RepID=A0ABR3XCW3_9PEZI
MEERVEEIAKRLIRRNAKAVGKPLLEQLQTTIVQELITLRRDILNIVGAVVKGSATREDGREQLNVVVRRAGMSIKEAAQKVRSWREKYEAELQGSITKAAEEHFKILDEIRDLAIQKIGMKWAWMDGITYKDWAKYHQLKSRFDEWHDDLQKLIVTHPTLEAAQLEGANIEDEAMNVAQTAAKELARLKQVGNWKLIAGDTSDEFDSDLTREAAEKAEAERAAAERAAEAAQAAEESESPGDPETVSSDHAQEHTEPAAEAVTEAASVLEPTEEDEALVSSATSDDTPPIASTEEAGAADGISTSSEVASSPADPDGASHTGSPDLAADATNAILNDPPVVVSNATDSNPSENVVPPVALPVEGSPHLEEEPVVAEALDEEPPAAATTTTVRSAMFGAAAQSVPSRQPILDDDALENVASVVESIRSNIPASFSSAAQSAYSDAVSRANQQYSQALSAVSVQIHGTPQPVHERVLASVTSAYSNALETASSRFDEALRLAQQQFGGTPSSTTKMLPTAIPVPSVPSVEWSRVESIASERLSQGRAWAAEQYERATSSLKELAPTASPSPSPGVLERGLSDAQHHYYAALGLAHARYSDFLEAASSALSSVTATPTPTDLAGTVSSVASVASESAASVGEAIADSWEVTVSKVSEVVYGAPTPTPWYEKVCQSGTELASAAASVAGSQAASVTSAAAAYASSGSEEAAKRYSSVSSLVSELLVGKEPTVSESVYSRLSAAYSHGVASVTSLAGEAQSTASSALGDAASVAKSAGEKVASAASGATEAVKSSVEHAKDEL